MLASYALPMEDNLGNSVHVPVLRDRKGRPACDLEKDDLASNLARVDSARDDLEPARGVLFAIVICSSMWATAILLGNWLLR